MPRTKFVAATDAHDAKLLPSARFFVQDDGQAQLTFRVNRSRQEGWVVQVTKNYYYTAAGPCLLTGTGSWTDDNAKLVHAESTVAIARLAEAFALDAAGLFADAMLPEKQRVITVVKSRRR